MQLTLVVLFFVASSKANQFNFSLHRQHLCPTEHCSDIIWNGKFNPGDERKEHFDSIFDTFYLFSVVMKQKSPK